MEELFSYSKKAAKLAEKSKNSDACHLCGIYFNLVLSWKNKYISTENLFKIPQRAGVAKIPLVDLLKYILALKWINRMENLPVFAQSVR